MDGLSKSEKRLYFAFLLICILRLGGEMFSYLPYLDDYTQYFHYPSLNIAKNVLLGGAKTIYTRPLASLFDIYFWSLFKECLFLARLILCLMYGISGVLFHLSLNRLGVKVSPLFLVLYGFLPLGSEALFWISASSRIAFSLFLISLWLFFLLRKKRFLFVIFHFLSYWFYEQTAALSFSLCLVSAILKKDRYAAIFALVSAAIFALFYLTFGKMGINAARLETVSPFMVPKAIYAAGCEIFYIFTSVHKNLYTRGIPRGTKLLLSSPEWLFIFALLSAMWFFLSKSYETSCADSPNAKKTSLKNFKKINFPKPRCILFFSSDLFKKLALGTVLFFSAFAPFYIQKTLWLNLRNTAPAFLGFSLFFDALSNISLKQTANQNLKKTPKTILKASKKLIIKSAVGSAVLFIFLVVGVSEASDYRKTADFDRNVVLALCREYKKTGSTDLYLKVSLPKYLNQNSIYHDHITTLYQLDWGYSSAVRAITKTPKITVRTPLSQ